MRVNVFTACFLLGSLCLFAWNVSRTPNPKRYRIDSTHIPYARDRVPAVEELPALDDLSSQPSESAPLESLTIKSQLSKPEGTSASTTASQQKPQAEPDAHFVRYGNSSKAPATEAAASRSCYVLESTELPGDVVRWGSDHKAASAEACCAACRSHNASPDRRAPECTAWVYCGRPDKCGAQRGECWLKSAAGQEVFEDLDLLQGRSDRWTSGLLAPPPPPGAGARGGAGQGGGEVVALETEYGRVRIVLRGERSPRAAGLVRALLRDHPDCRGCSFYRAEPVPPGWGSLDLPDTYEGGRWGPPYALLQGGLRAAGAPEPSKATPREDAPVIRRGMVAWAGGGAGPDFFVALADHPEWGKGHTVFADVVAEDWPVLDKIMEQPAYTNPGKIPITNLKRPVPIKLQKV